MVGGAEGVRQSQPVALSYTEWAFRRVETHDETRPYFDVVIGGTRLCGSASVIRRALVRVGCVEKGGTFRCVHIRTRGLGVGAQHVCQMHPLCTAPFYVNTGRTCTVLDVMDVWQGKGGKGHLTDTKK